MSELLNFCWLWKAEVQLVCGMGILLLAVPLFAWLWHVESQQVLVFPTEKMWGYIYYLNKYLE